MNSQKDSIVLRGLREESGQAGPWLTVLIVMMIGITGLVVDVGHAYVCHRQLQASTDAASLAGAYAMTLPGASTGTVNAKVYALSSATTHGVTGANATPNLPNVTITTSYRCVTDSTIVTAPCSASATGYNVIQVDQSSTIPTYFIRVLAAVGIKSAQTVNVNTTSTSTMMAGKAAQVNVAMVLDTTASMGNSDTDINCNNTRIHCALSGVQTLLQGLAPCAPSSGNGCTAFDQVSLFTFPNVQANTASNDTTCPSNNPKVIPYSTPAVGAIWSAPTGTGATYQITNYLSDYSSNNKQGGSVSSSSALGIATGSGTGNNCRGVQTPGGEGTYFAGAIYAAQSSLTAAQAGSPGSENIMIILSDGDANAKSGAMVGANGKNIAKNGNTYPSLDDQCHQAITAAHYASANGTIVYTIAYGASNTGCSTDTGALAITPCATLQQMSSGWSSGDTSRFYSDANASQNKGQCGAATSYSLNGIFSSIAGKISQARLIPNGII